MKQLNEKVKYWRILLTTTSLLSFCSAKNLPCNLRETNDGSVCVCTKNYCDYLDNRIPIFSNSFSIISSTKAGLRFASSKGRFGTGKKHIIEDRKVGGYKIKDDQYFDPVALLIDSQEGAFLDLGNESLHISAFQDQATISISRSVEFQTITGFGGAFTGSVSYLLQQVSQALQDQIYKSFFANEGIAFTIIRMSIGGSDFDLEPWTYNEVPHDDVKLSNFTRLDARDQLKVQQLTRMKRVARLDKIKIKAAAWSPPLWMKSNLKLNGVNYLKPEYYQTWADYHLRFLELMDAKNMPIWAISTGNEPTNGFMSSFFVNYLNLGWSPKNQAIWLNENLGPTIRNSKYKNVLIFGNDDQRFTFPLWFKLMNISRSNALKYLDGLAVHWYYDEFFGPSHIDDAHKLMPEKLILNTESCVGAFPWEGRGPVLGSWERAEKYLRAFLQDLQHSVNGWIDWNLLLNEEGGPNYVKNYVDAPMILNVTNRAEIYKQPIFYAIGHFSKFIPEGSTRIEANVLNSKSVETVAFKRPDERIAVVIFNSGSAAVDVALNDSVRGNIVINIPPRSVHTMIYN